MTSRLTLTLSIGITLVISACSIVSGWSDLQREPPPGTSSSGSSSSGTSGGTSSSSGTSGGTSSSGTSGGTSSGTTGGTSGSARIACGLELCEPSQACCIVGGASSQICVSERIACPNSGVFIECQAPTDCAARTDGKNVCCWDIGFADNSGQRTSTCTAACAGTGRYPVCDRQTLTGCTGATECTRATGSPSDSPIFACR